MASIVITIETDGAAFHDKESELDQAAQELEIARVLQGLASRFDSLRRGELIPLPCDIDGKPCGKVEVIPDATEREQREQTKELESRTSLRYALRGMVDAINKLPLLQDAFKEVEGLYTAWVVAGKVLKQEGM
jgi:hypothetical protein